MTQLTEAIEAETEVIVAESITHRELLLSCDADLELVFGPGICDDFPVVLAIHERAV